MKRDKARDDKFFDCTADHEINYVARLYAEKEEVKDFLIKKWKDGTIKYMTHFNLYKLIENDLGYRIPN